jgi:hypothetical protein
MREIQANDLDEDSVLIAEVRDQLRDQGLPEADVEFQLEVMQDAGVFRCPTS